MSEKHLPKHRNASVAPLHTRLSRRVRSAALFSGVAAVATGAVVSAGVLTQSAPIDGAAAALSTSTPGQDLSQSEIAEREDRASRSSSDRRPAADQVKARALSNSSGVARTKTEDVSKADPKALARVLMPKLGLSASEFGCVDNLWASESDWKVNADNPTSSAYGIPQALPGSKMASAGSDWEDNPETQIRWGLGYIKDRYGTACAAWSFKQGAGWY